MLSLVLSLILFLFTSTAALFVSNWTWLGGSTSLNTAGQYGYITQPSPSNYPGSRQSASFCLHNERQKIYLFGGFGRAKSNTTSYLNDLWHYDIRKNEWIWMSGTSNVRNNGTYEVKGSPSIDYLPASRGFHGTQLDAERNLLYIYAGFSRLGVLNDLWSVDVDTLSWTWLSGDQPPVLTPSNCTAEECIPGGRFLFSMDLDIENQLIYVFGGTNISSADQKNNELWRYDIIQNDWKRLGRTSGIGGSFGNLSVPSSSNLPRSRYTHCSFFDQNLKKLYIFSGFLTGFMNDIWEFDTKTNFWTWIAGSRNYTRNGSYGTKGVANESSYPAGRDGGAVTYDQNRRLFFLFGGNAFDEEGNYGFMNDLWMFNMSSLTWTWISGQSTINATTEYGDMLKASNYTPTGRGRHHLQFNPTTESLYLFGGAIEVGNYNDLWSITVGNAISRLCPPESTYVVQALVLNCSGVLKQLSDDCVKCESIVTTPSQTASLVSMPDSPTTLFSSVASFLTFGMQPSIRPTETVLSTEHTSIDTVQLVLIIISSIIVAMSAFIGIYFRQRMIINRKSKPTYGSSVDFKTEQSFLDTNFSVVTTSDNTSFSTLANVDSFIVAVPGFMQVEQNIDYTLREQLSFGGQASVFLAKLHGEKMEARSASPDVVAKIMFAEPTISQKQRDMFLQEVSLMHQFSKYPNFGHFLGYDEKNMLILMTYYPYGSLSNFIGDKPCILSGRVRLNLLRDITRAIQIMHSHEIAHCDLKPDNILLEYLKKSNEYRAVLTDFGITRILLDQKELDIKGFRPAEVVGASLFYSSPEALQCIKQPSKEMRRDIGALKELKCSDIYSFACIIYELVNKKRIWR